MAQKPKHWVLALLKPNNLRSTGGYIRSLLRKGLNVQGPDALDKIYNYLPIDERIGSSGQPTERQFQAIRAAGFAHVINLAPHGAENSIDDEQSVVERLGMSYCHIPVDFKNPTEEDYRDFSEQMRLATESETRVWVHCAANMRVSAFIYRYSLDNELSEREEARARLHAIWTPFGVWERFVRHAEAPKLESA